jgi:hypothetical protein
MTSAREMDLAKDSADELAGDEPKIRERDSPSPLSVRNQFNPAVYNPRSASIMDHLHLPGASLA